MNASGISCGSTDAMEQSVASVQQAGTEAAMGMMDATMDAAAIMMAQLLEALPEPGLGGSVNTYA